MGSKRRTKLAQGRNAKRASRMNGERPATPSKYAERHDRIATVAEIDDPVHGQGGDHYAAEVR
jgi:hypothetical protein